MSSLVFYAFNSPILLLLLIISIFINSATSYALVNLQSVNKKALATAGVILNLAIIIFFKYSGMFSKTFAIENTDIGHFLLMLPLPLGISFFTFEGISLVVDTYKEKDTDKHQSFVVKSFMPHFGNTLLFVSFFPHLIAGPILKAHEFYPQISQKYLRDIDWDKAFRQLVVGYFLKIVVADNLKDQTFWIAYPYFLKYSSETLLIMLFGYSIQIFADFAGYSLIALGLASLLGYKLNPNFNFPYLSTSFTEFWRRWHISLSSFLREYLYIPLGGNRHGKIRTYFNLMITMILGGLWHGAGWSYAIWGLAHGLFLALERLFNDYINFSFSKYLSPFKLLLVFGMVTLAWLLFKLPDFDHVIYFLKAVYQNWGIFPDAKTITIIIIYSLPVILYTIIGYIKEMGMMIYFKSWEWIAFGTMIFLICTNAGSSADFIYFQF